jgi:hypothetical protein
LEAGAEKVTVAWVTPGVAPVMEGAPGTVKGVTLADGTEVFDPRGLVAVTVQV